MDVDTEETTMAMESMINIFIDSSSYRSRVQTEINKILVDKYRNIVPAMSQKYPSK